MIKLLGRGERGKALEVLLADCEIDRENARFCIDKSDKVLCCEVNGQIAGCGTFRLWGKERTRADAYLYVRPERRGSGLGKAVLEALTHESGNLEFISTRVETDSEQSLRFFQKAGFEPWYTELILRYEGSRPQDGNLELTTYTTELLERYVEALRISFYEMRRSNDFKSYLCCEPDEAKARELEERKDSILVLMDGEKLAASIIVGEGYLDDFFVSPGCQGQGLGRQMLCAALCKSFDNGYPHPSLSAIEWNKRALSLYFSLGFQVEKRVNFLRLSGSL